MDKTEFTLEMAKEFHGRMAAIVDRVQEAVWQAGVHDLLGYDSDFGFGQKRGVQTLVLKTSHRSAYLRLDWNTLFGTSDADQEAVDVVVRHAVNALS